ncbi:MAG: SUMF1/EgtB/PvdO family nonheme iron enzyme [Candidatus Riflebacteria bacterium]|nr:SUMF1/EgtB/PvdO family nonheme iron enzyme [Candidatus Riflebacteria bacterium]
MNSSRGDIQMLRKELIITALLSILAVILPAGFCFGGQPAQEINLGDGVTMSFVDIPSGTFVMGSSDCPPKPDLAGVVGPPHHVRLTRGFLMGTTEVTQEQYWQITKLAPSNGTSGKRRKRPVERVTWYDAVEFCNALSQQQGLQPCYVIDKSRRDPKNRSTPNYLVNCDFLKNGFRLPTEAEWEYACRGGTTGYFYWEDPKVTGDYSWFDGNSFVEWGKAGQIGTHEVGKKIPNAFGLYDMSGNVWEWCDDWWGNYDPADQTDPHGPDGGLCRCLRGGAYCSHPSNIGSPYRMCFKPNETCSENGFRVVRTK